MELSIVGEGFKGDSMRGCGCGSLSQSKYGLAAAESHTGDGGCGNVSEVSQVLLLP